MEKLIVTFEDVIKKYKDLEKELYYYEKHEEMNDMEDDDSEDTDYEGDIDLASMSNADKLKLVEEIFDSCKDEKACVALAKKIKALSEKMIDKKKSGTRSKLKDQVEINMDDEEDD